MSVSRRLVRIMVLGVSMALLSSCALLPTFGKKSEIREQVYTLDPVVDVADADGAVCGSIALGDAIAAPGFRSSRMAYSTASYEIDYFAYARWADTIARLLRRPLQRGFEAHDAFPEVLSAPTIAPTLLRLELSDVSLIQQFETRQSESSTVELGAHVRLFALNPNRVLATKTIVLAEPAGGTPAGGVGAANVLAGRLVNEVLSFAAAHCRSAE